MNSVRQLDDRRPSICGHPGCRTCFHLRQYPQLQSRWPCGLLSFLNVEECRLILEEDGFVTQFGGRRLPILLSREFPLSFRNPELS